MKICFTLDDVLRAKTQQIGKIYQKVINPDIKLDEIDLTAGDLTTALNMTEKEYNKFLYEDCAFEIFGEAPMTEKMVDKKLNLWHIKVNDEYEDVSVMLANSKEFNASIGFTYFFLSQAGTRIREIYLPSDSVTIWDKCDVLVTADPKLLSCKPCGKVSVKIEMPYNAECKSDKSYASLSSLLNDNNLIEDIKKIIKEQ